MKIVLPIVLILAVIGVAVTVWWIGEPPSTEATPGPSASPKPSGPSRPADPSTATSEGPGQAVRGVVVDAETDAPAACDTIHAIPVGTDPTLVWGHAEQDGRLRFQVFPPGTYDLVAYRLPNRIGLVHGLEVRDHPVTGLRIAMHRGGTLRFHITDRRRTRPAEPLTAAYRVYLEQDGRTASPRGVLLKAPAGRADGSFDITAPPGRIHVYITDHQGKAWKQEQVVEVQPGELVDVRFTLD